MASLIIPFLAKIFFSLFFILLFFLLITYIIKFNSKEKRAIYSIYILVGVLLAASFIIFSFYAPSFISANSLKDINIQSNSDFTTIIYNLMSPFIAIAAAILTFMAFWVQHSANNEMLKNNEKQNVEKQFYEMLQIHKQNVKELEWENWSIQSSPQKNILNTNKYALNNLYSHHKISGCKVFELHWLEYVFIEQSLINSIKLFITNEKINIKYSNLNSWKKIISFSYNIYMQGMSSIKEMYQKNTLQFFDDCENNFFPIKNCLDTKNSLKSLNKYSFNSKDKPLFENDKDNLIPLYLYFLLSYFKRKIQPYKISLYNSHQYNQLLGANFFSGHYDELNRYYRHLYQTVRIVANYDSKIISYDEKRKFLRMLRAQLTNNEQLLLFYNWMSGFRYGEDWEKQNGNHFFTEFRMIHNLNPENSSLFIKMGNDNIIRWIKSFNPNYNDYDEHPLFEFEDQ